MVGTDSLLLVVDVFIIKVYNLFTAYKGSFLLII